MTDENMKIAWLGSSDTDEIMRRLRKNIVCSLITGNPRMSVSRWVHDKESAVRAER
jgi:hypothetical protein